MKKILSLLLLLSLTVSSQVSKNRLKTTNYGWINRVVPTGAYLDSTFSSFWMPTGNAVGSNTAFIGTTDNRSILFKTNNIYRGKLDSAGVFDFRYNPAIFGGNSSTFQLQLKNGTNYLKMNVDTTVSNPNTQIFVTNGGFALEGQNTGAVVIAANDNIALGSANFTPTARVDIVAGSATWPSLKLRSQTAVTTPTLGNIWYETIRGFMLHGRLTANTDFSVATTATLGTTFFAVGGSSITLSNIGGAYASVHLGTVPSATTGNNFFIASNGTSDSYLNAPTDSADLTITKGNGNFFMQMHGKRYNSALSTIEFRNAERHNANATAGGNQFYINSVYNRGFKQGTIATDYNLIFGAVTYTGSGTGITITNPFPFWVTKSIASTGATITNNWGIGTDGLANFTSSVVIGASAHTPNYALDITGNAGITGALTTSASILSKGQTQGIGYATGSGSTVTQGTSRATGVTINAINGAITLFTAAGLVTYTSFIVTNNTVASTDHVHVTVQSGTNKYLPYVTTTSAGSFEITFNTSGGVSSDTPVFLFEVVKGTSN